MFPGDLRISFADTGLSDPCAHPSWRKGVVLPLMVYRKSFGLVLNEQAQHVKNFILNEIEPIVV